MITVGSGRGGREGGEGGRNYRKKWEDRINGGKEREERDTCIYMH